MRWRHYWGWYRNNSGLRPNWVWSIQWQWRQKERLNRLSNNRSSDTAPVKPQIFLALHNRCWGWIKKHTVAKTRLTVGYASHQVDYWKSDGCQRNQRALENWYVERTKEMNLHCYTNTNVKCSTGNTLVKHRLPWLQCRVQTLPKVQGLCWVNISLWICYNKQQLWRHRGETGVLHSDTSELQIKTHVV